MTHLPDYHAHGGRICGRGDAGNHAAIYHELGDAPGTAPCARPFRHQTQLRGRSVEIHHGGRVRVDCRHRRRRYYA